MKAKGSRMRICIIGAGPSGLASGRSLAEGGHEVNIYERRKHIAGNCYDEYNNHNILVHKYGPHYFRTNSEKLIEWLSHFTEWHTGRYFVRTKVNDLLVPMPVSLSTMTTLKGEIFTEKKFRDYLQTHRVPIECPQNAEEQCLSKVGKELYELLFKGYTQKQWGVPPTDLDPSITARIPLRFDWDERYPNENFQVIPKNGYTAMFEKMGEHQNINIHLEAVITSKDIQVLRRKYDLLIYTGALDEFYDYQFGKLDYRSLEFRWEHFEQSFVQPCVQINYPNDYDYTRTVEIKHVTGQEIHGTSICYEYPQSQGEPFYPILTKENQNRFARYFELSKTEAQESHPVYFIGRLAEFKYYNMDHVLLNGLKLAQRILNLWSASD